MWARVGTVVILLVYSVVAEHRLTTRHLEEIQTLSSRNLLDDERIDLKFIVCDTKMKIILHDQLRYSRNSRSIQFYINAYTMTVSEKKEFKNTRLKKVPMPHWSCKKDVKITVSWSMSTLMISQECDRRFLLNLRYKTDWKVKGVSVSSDKSMQWSYGEGICPKKGNSQTTDMPDANRSKVSAVHELLTIDQQNIKALKLKSLIEKETIDLQFARCQNKINIYLHSDDEYSDQFGESIHFEIDEYSLSVTEKTFFGIKRIKDIVMAPWSCMKSINITVTWRKQKLIITKDCGTITLIDISYKRNWKVQGVSVSSIKPLRWKYGEGLCVKKEIPGKRPNTASRCTSLLFTSNDCNDLANRNHTQESIGFGITRGNNPKQNSGNTSKQNSGINNNNTNHHINPNINHKPPLSDAKGDNSENNQSSGNSSLMTDANTSDSYASNVADKNTTGPSTTTQLATGHGSNLPKNSGVKTSPSTGVSVVISITMASIMSQWFYNLST